jgi:glycosyltransferase involved in cell wall biosynthesis
VSAADLYRQVGEADVCINLRHATSGETSAMVQRVLACGRPVVVSDVGWFAELPDSCALKIPVGDAEPDALVAAITRLAEEPRWRVELGRAALRYAERLDVASRARAYDEWVRGAESSATEAARPASTSIRRPACAGSAG